jgi:hypothetical protein
LADARCCFQKDDDDPKSLDTSTSTLNELQQNPPDASEVLVALIGAPKRKYDGLLDENLRLEIRKRRWLDMSTGLAVLQRTTEI